jgi:tRNA U38,U39,U40 pseudouridine synthase TruA
LFVLQPKANKEVGCDRTDKGIKAGGDSMQIETSAQGTSTTETVGDKTKADINVFAETLMTDAAVASEV